MTLASPTYNQPSGPIDPEDWIEYEDRQEAVRSMGRIDDQLEGDKMEQTNYDK
jgi:hypothetical protein